MENQLLFPDLLPPPVRVRPDSTDSIFWASLPDHPAAVRLDWRAQHLCATQCPGGRPLARNRLHLSLHNLGTCDGVPPHILRAAGLAAAKVVATTTPFTITLDRLCNFSGSHGRLAVVACATESNDALRRFHLALGEAAREFGFNCSAHARFTPHVTLLYAEHGVAEQAIEPVTWTLTELVLVHSLLGQSRHVHLERRPLATT